MRNRFTNLGWVVTLVLALIPVVLWLGTQPTQWGTAKIILDNLGKLFGLAGLALFCWSVILSARLKFYDKLFLGLDNMYRAHHIIGCVSLILLLIHPMLLTMRYFLSSPIAAYEFVIPSLASPFRLLGSITLALFMILMLISLYINLRQERLVMVMRLMGLLVFLGGIHAVFVGGSDVNNLFWLQTYIRFLLTLALVVYVYRSLFHGNFHKYLSYTISQVVPKGDVVELHMKPQNKVVGQLPGQFAFVKLDADGVLGESHPFTISADPHSQELRFSIKQLGDYTQALTSVRVGQKVKIDAPYGSFSNQIIKARHQIWVAGGIGVTPFLAMAAALDNTQKVELFYSVKTKEEAVYADELQARAKQNSNLTLYIVDSSKDGLLTADGILSKVQTGADIAFLICGPPAMMKALRSQLRAAGVHNKQIHTEEFSLL